MNDSDRVAEVTPGFTIGAEYTTMSTACRATHADGSGALHDAVDMETVMKYTMSVENALVGYEPASGANVHGFVLITTKRPGVWEACSSGTGGSTMLRHEQSLTNSSMADTSDVHHLTTCTWRD